MHSELVDFRKSLCTSVEPLSRDKGAEDSEGDLMTVLLASACDQMLCSGQCKGPHLRSPH